MPTEDAYSSGHLVLSHFGTCMCSYVETNLSLTCLVSGPLNFEHPSVLLFCLICIFVWSRLQRILVPSFLGLIAWDEIQTVLKSKLVKLHTRSRSLCENLLHPSTVSSFGRLPTENDECFAESSSDIVFINISAFSVSFVFGFFLYRFVQTKWS